MPYFPVHSSVVPYRCPGCGGYYYPASVNCLVIHLPGTCCHKYEEPAEPPDPSSFRSMLERASNLVFGEQKGKK